MPDEDPYLLHLKSESKYESWMECLRYEDISTHNPGNIFVLDITSSGDTSRWDVHVNVHSLSAELGKKALINGTRLIVFDPADRMYMQRHVGVMYNVDPGFFRAVASNCNPTGYYERMVHRVPEFLLGGRPQYLDLGYGWAGAIHRNGNNNIVLVSAPNSYVLVPTEQPFSEKSLYQADVRFSTEYIEALKNEPSFFVEVHKNPLLLLSPALNLHASHLCNGLIYANQCFRLGKNREYKPELVEKAWDLLRMMRHDGMGPLNCIQQYDNNHNDGKTQHVEEYKNLVKRFKCIEEQITRTEALVRDYLQHHVGMFSLEESRASIKQARAALEESKRTKLITVLAIFFVPISLSTSAFGMNIHELNENGQPLWVFGVTTVLVVVVTIMIWGFMYQFQKYNLLPEAEYNAEGRPWPIRLGRLLQLILRGHIIWTWKSGILLSLLTDGKVGFLRSCITHVAGVEEGLTRTHPNHHSHNAGRPCDYIETHLGGKKERVGEKDPFGCSHLKGQLIGEIE